MNLFKKISAAFFDFLDLGVQHAKTNDEAVKIPLINAIYLACMVGNTFLVVLSLFSNSDASVLVVLLAAFIETILVLLNINGYFKVGHYIIVFGLFSFLMSLEVFTNVNWGLDFMILIFVFISYILFSGKEQLFVIGFQVIMFFSLPFLYDLLPIDLRFNFDEIPFISEVMFLLYVFISGIILTAYQVLVKYHRQKQEDTINQLKQSNDELQQTKKEIEQFTYIVSKNIKSQLNQIGQKTAQTVIASQKNDYKIIETNVASLHQAYKEMYFWVNDILEKSSVENVVSTQKKSVNLNLIIPEVLTHLEVSYPNIRLSVIDLLPTIFINEKDAFIIFYNIINVLWQYQSDTDIEILASQNKDNTIITLRQAQIKPNLFLSLSVFKLEQLIIKKWNGTLDLVNETNATKLLVKLPNSKF